MSNRQPDLPIHVSVVRTGAGLEQYGGAIPGPEQLAARIDEIGDSISWFKESIESRLDAIGNEEPSSESWSLDAIELTVSIDLEAEAGVIFARAKAAAGLELKLTWSKG